MIFTNLSNNVGYLMKAGENVDSPTRSVILSRDMTLITFKKNNYSVTFPKKAFKKLYVMAMKAEKLNVEIKAEILVEKGKMREIVYPVLEEIIVIETDLHFGIKANDRRYFDDTGDSIIRLRECSYNLVSGRVDTDIAKNNLIRLKDTLTKYYTRLSYQYKGRSMKTVNPKTIASIITDKESIIDFVTELKGKSAYASEWFSSKPFRPLRIVDGKLVYVEEDETNVGVVPDEVIRLHNHPVGCPSPPSCWIRDNKIRGDVSEIFEGGTYGNLLNRGKGKWELVLFKEDDLTNLAKYIVLFSGFWGWIRDRAKIADDIRKVALKPTVIEEQE